MADLVILDAKVCTMDPARPLAEAVAVRGDRIAAVGTSREIRRLATSNTWVIDARGRLVLPGFNDAHLHFAQGGFALLGADLRPAVDEHDFARRLARRVASVPKGRWITGGNWDHEAWPSRRLPTRQLVDPVTPDHPVMLRRIDAHISLANTVALRLADIGRDTPDPPGGRIQRDDAGEPTGILIDTAQMIVCNLIGEPSEEESLDALRAAMRRAAAVGLTSVQSPSSVTEFRIYQELRRRGELTVRIYAPLQVEALDHLVGSGLRSNFGDALLRTGGLKIFADGSLGAGSALFFEPYDDNPATTGLVIYEQRELDDLVARTDAAGLQAVIHAIGDKAVDWSLSAIERARSASGRRDARHRIEHAQMVRPEDRPRFARLGVVASIQPTHATDDMRWVGRRMGRRTAQAYPFRTLLDAGARVACGSDWPVEPPDPLPGIHAAVTRQSSDGEPPGGWHPEERVSVDEAVAGWTTGAAWAEFQEHEKGSVEAGKLADLVILSADVFAVEPREILDARVDVTVFGGKVIHER